MCRVCGIGGNVKSCYQLSVTRNVLSAKRINDCYQLLATHLLHITGGYNSYLASPITGNLRYAIFAEFNPFGDGKGNGSMPLISSSQQTICNHKTLVYIRRFSLVPVFPAIMVMAINFLVDAVWTLVFAAWPYVIRHLQVYEHEDYTGSKKQSISYKTLSR